MHGHAPHLLEQDVSREARLDLVGMGLGIAVVPDSAARAREDIVFRTIDEPDAVVPVEAIWSRADPTRCATAF